MSGEIPGWGGAREGAGRPPGPSDPDAKTAKAQYDEWRAHGEKYKALQAEVDYMAEVGLYVPRAAVQQATATAQAIFVQHVRSIGNTLERTLNLAPEVIEAIEKELDAAMNRLADDLEAMASMAAATKQ
jgi:hypothetical protein